MDLSRYLQWERNTRRMWVDAAEDPCCGYGATRITPKQFRRVWDWAIKSFPTTLMPEFGVSQTPFLAVELFHRHLYTNKVPSSDFVAVMAVSVMVASKMEASVTLCFSDIQRPSSTSTSVLQQLERDICRDVRGQIYQPLSLDIVTLLSGIFPTELPHKVCQLAELILLIALRTKVTCKYPGSLQACAALYIATCTLRPRKAGEVMDVLADEFPYKPHDIYTRALALTAVYPGKALRGLPKRVRTVMLSKCKVYKRYLRNTIRSPIKV